MTALQIRFWRIYWTWRLIRNPDPYLTAFFGTITILFIALSWRALEV